MKLYIPRQFSLITDAKEYEHVMDMQDGLFLKAIMENFDSFEELFSAFGKYTKSANVELRYKLSFSGMPAGSVGDWFRCVVNIFGDVGRTENGGKMPSKISKERLAAFMAEEMSCSERTALGRLKTLMHGGYLRMETGAVLFPVDMLVR